MCAGSPWEPEGLGNGFVIYPTITALDFDKALGVNPKTSCKWNYESTQPGETEHGLNLDIYRFFQASGYSHSVA